MRHASHAGLAREQDAPADTEHPALTLIRSDDRPAAAFETCGDMLADLDREIRAARSELEVRALPVRAAALVKHEAPYWIYRLELASAVPPLRAEAPVLLDAPDGSRFPAQVVSFREHVLRIATTTPLPEPIAHGYRVIIDDVWLLERLRTRLAQVRMHLERGDDSTFNADLAQLVIGEGDFDANRIETSEAVPTDILDALNERQQDVLREGLTKRALYVWGPPGTGKTTTAAALVHAHVLAGRRVLVVTPSNASADVIALALADRLKDSPAFKNGLMLRVGPRPTHELRARYGAHLIPQDVARRLADEVYGPRREMLLAEISRLDLARAQLIEQTREYDRAVGRLESSRHELAHLEDTAAAFAARRFEELLDECQVLITPICNVYLSRLVRGRFDVVLVDEASMVTVPQLYLAAGLSRAQVVVAGDFCQLSAPVMHRPADEVPWLSRDVFHRLGIPDDVAREDDPPYLRMLTEQYRMAPSICRVVSRMSYMDRLTTAPSVARRESPPWARDHGSLILLDTGSLTPRAVIPPGTRTRRNQVHARVVRELVTSLTKGSEGSNAGTLMVLSPYAGQIELLQSELAAVRRHLGSSVRISTVHRAQGSEADTVVLSIDDAPGAPTSQFIAARDWTAAGARLFNVALSRARGRVVVCADVAYLERVGGPVVRCLIRELRSSGQVIGPDDI